MRCKDCETPMMRDTELHTIDPPDGMDSIPAHRIVKIMICPQCGRKEPANGNP